MRMMTLLALGAAGATATAVGCEGTKRTSTAGAELRIESEVACVTCSIVLDTLVTLEHVDFIGPSTAIDRDSAGTTYLLDRADRIVKAYGADGRFLRTVGRRGAGPGEYEMVNNVHTARDGSIHILDGLLGRRSVFRPNAAFDSSTRVDITPGYNNSAVFRTDGQLVVNGRSRIAADSGGTVHLIDQAGRITRSVESSPVDPATPWRQDRLLWERRNGELLVARPHSLTMTVYTHGLARKGSITRVADWFPSSEPEGQPSDGVFDQPFAPRLWAVWEDAQGVVWLMMAVPSASWTPRRRVPGLSGNEYVELAKRPRLVTVIEALDVERRSVLARSRFEGPIGVPFRGGLLAKSVEGAEGEPGVRISRLQLKR